MTLKAAAEPQLLHHPETMIASSCASQKCCQQQARASSLRTAGRLHSVARAAAAGLPSLAHAALVGRCGPAAPPRHQLRRTGTSAAAAAAATRSSNGDVPAASLASGGRHAFLHDFCMCIPYGTLLLAGGLVGKLLCGWGQLAMVMMVLGAAQVVLSNLSLRQWRAGQATTAITLTEGGLAGWLAYYAYRAVQQGVSSTFMGALLGLSAAMALFLVYNVAAGGNPPRTGSHAATVAAASAMPAAAEPPAAT